MPTITVDEWMAELERLGRASPDGLTSEELAEAWCCSRRVSCERIRALIRAKRAVLAGHRPIVRIDGKPAAVPVYRLSGAQ